MNIEETLRRSKIRHLPLAPLVCVGTDDSLQQVISAMQAHRVGCVLVTENHRLAGIFTERDFLVKVIAEEVNYARPVRDFMTPAPRTLHADDSVADAIRLMTQGGYRNVPLVDEKDRLVGRSAVSSIINFLAESLPQEVLAVPPRPQQNFNEPDGA